MTRIIGEGGLFNGEDNASEKKPRTHGRKIAAVLLGLNVVAIAGLHVSCEVGDEQTAKALAEQEAIYNRTAGTPSSSTSSLPTTHTETALPSVSTSTSPTTIPKVPFASSTTSPSKASAPKTVNTTRRPTTTPSKSPERSSSAPKLCHVAPVSLGVAAVTNVCGGDMLGYSADSAPFPLSPGTQVAFACQTNDGKGRIQVTVSNDAFFMSPNSLGNPC